MEKKIAFNEPEVTEKKSLTKSRAKEEVVIVTDCQASGQDWTCCTIEMKSPHGSHGISDQGQHIQLAPFECNHGPFSRNEFRLRTIQRQFDPIHWA